MDWTEEYSKMPILVTLPVQYKKYYTSRIFALHKWQIILIKKELNNFYRFKENKLNYYSIIKSIWGIIPLLKKENCFHPRHFFSILFFFICNIYLTLFLMVHPLISKMRGKSANFSQQEEIIFDIWDEYLNFCKHESWFKFDFIARISALWKMDTKPISSVRYCVSMIFFTIQFFLRALLAVPLSFMKGENEFMAINITDVPLAFETFQDIKYIGQLPKSAYIKVPRYRDLSEYLAKMSDDEIILDIDSVEMMFISCICPKDFPIYKIINKRVVIKEAVGENKIRYVFSIRTSLAKKLFTRIQDTSIKIEDCII